jgi:hypothetical protein
MTEQQLKDVLRLCEQSKAYKDGAAWAAMAVVAVRDAIYQLHVEQRR